MLCAYRAPRAALGAGMLWFHRGSFQSQALIRHAGGVIQQATREASFELP